MGQSSNKEIINKMDVKISDEKILKLNESFDKSLAFKKLKEEEEKNSLLKINKKWENEEKDRIQKLLKSVNKKNNLEKIIDKKEDEIIKLRIIENNEKIMKSSEENNREQGENSKKNKLNSIIDKSNSFLDGELTDLNQRLIYAMEVNRYLSEEINTLKKDNSKNIIIPKHAIFNKNYIIKFLGYLGCELFSYNINVFIEKYPTNEIIRDITFKMILSGLATQRAYKIIIQSEDDKRRFKEDIQLWHEFLEKVKIRVIKNHNLEEKDIIFFNHDTNNYEVMMIIYNKRLNGIENTLKYFHLKILTGNLLNNIILSPNMFEIKYCKKRDEWKSGNLYRGGERYHPPYGWTGFALKLRNKYGDNFDWLGKTGENGDEWCVAFHGIGKGNELQKLFSILNTNLREGPKQRYSKYKNLRKNTKKDYDVCGNGVYLTPDIKKAENYAFITKLGSPNKDFQFAIQARVDPNKIRDPGVTPVNWVLNGNNNEIRPYRLLVKFI